jgi:TolB-like protein
MKTRICASILILVAIGAFAKGKIEYEVTEVKMLDDREKGVDLNFNGGDYFLYSNTIVDKKGKTIAALDLNSKPGYNGSKACIHFTYALDPGAKDPFAGAGTNLKADYSSTDMSQYMGVRFYAKGTGQVLVRFGTETTRKTYNYPLYLLSLKPDWTLIEIPFSDFKPPEWGPKYEFKTTEIFSFEIGNINTQTARADMYIDDIGFFKAKIKEAAVKTETTQTDNKTTKDSSSVVKKNGQKKLSQKKLDDVMGKRIAVVGLDSQNIDSKVTGVVIDFIINAFVNSGSVKVVDRSSIERILKEQAFQMQDFVDNSKMTEIGRLLGAEFVVTGSLSKIDETMYLNIRLISVKTAEIIGSSVTSAPEKSDYIELCNDAVLKLFM